MPTWGFGQVYSPDHHLLSCFDRVQIDFHTYPHTYKLANTQTYALLTEPHKRSRSDINKHIYTQTNKHTDKQIQTNINKTTHKQTNKQMKGTCTEENNDIHGIRTLLNDVLYND